MTKLEHDSESIFDLEIGQIVYLGSVPYKIERFSRGGMGFIMYLCLYDLHRTSKFSVHGNRLVVKAALGDESEYFQKLFLRELTVWAGFRNTNIVNLNEIIQIDKYWAAAMNWCHGSLRDYMKDTNSLNMKVFHHIITSIISALSYAEKCHSVLHLDLKPENVLYDKRYKPHGLFMVSDWGIASIRGELLKNTNVSTAPYSDDFSTFNEIGTLPYMAPERFLKNVKSSIGSDVYSLGVIIFELLAGYLPYDKKFDIRQQIIKHDYLQIIDRAIYDEIISSELGNLILSMMHPDPILRISNYDDLSTRLQECRTKQGIFSKIFKKS
jgi:serine/threonine protein kinase